jgi:hypothetical protein
MANKKANGSRGVARSAKTGRFVKKSYAKRHPNTTVVEGVAVSQKSRVVRVVRDKTTGKFVSNSKIDDILDLNDIVIQTVKR